MNDSIVYVEMNVRKESFSLCCYTNEKEQTKYFQFLIFLILHSPSGMIFVF